MTNPSSVPSSVAILLSFPKTVDAAFATLSPTNPAAPDIVDVNAFAADEVKLAAV